MSYIFYDLETTDLNYCGQILNYAFVEVDEDWKEVSEFCGKVKISRTQLPNPYAILANRVNVLTHDGDPEHIAVLHGSGVLRHNDEDHPAGAGCGWNRARCAWAV